MFPPSATDLALTGLVSAKDAGEKLVCALQSGTAPLQLSMFSVENGRFYVSGGLDGLVLTPSGMAVRETALFTDLDKLRTANAPREPAGAFDDVFIGFDAAWTNWFHWLCFALVRSSLAAELLPPSCRILLPDYNEPGRSRVRAETCQQSIVAAGLAERITLVSPGLYSANRVRFLWSNLAQPAEVMRLDAFHRVFRRMRRGLRRHDDMPNRLLIARDRDANSRLHPVATALLHRLAAAHGFVPMHFAEMDFAAQSEAMFNANAVVGVHGAGLTNVLFGRPSLRVLELNQTIGEEAEPRPWFRRLCVGRHQRHRMLSTEPGHLTEEHLERALTELCEGLPPPRSVTRAVAAVRASAQPPVLATVCNTTPNALQVALWLKRDGVQSVIDLADVLGEPGDVGLTGLAWHDGMLYCAVQSTTRPRILLLDRRLTPVRSITDPGFADLHSLTVEQDGLLIASTGNGRVFRYKFSDERLETLCALGDNVHLNSACRSGEGILVCCQDLSPLDPAARGGGVYDATARRVLLDGLGYPHSVMPAGDGFIVLDSGRGRVLRFGHEGVRQVCQLGGFLRGATLHHDTLFIAAGPQRLVSRSTGEIQHQRTMRQALQESVAL